MGSTKLQGRTIQVWYVCMFERVIIFVHLGVVIEAGEGEELEYLDPQLLIPEHLKQRTKKSWRDTNKTKAIYGGKNIGEGSIRRTNKKIEQVYKEPNISVFMGWLGNKERMSNTRRKEKKEGKTNGFQELEGKG